MPVLNRNLGLDGHNMLIIGMGGVPVKHISTLAKPATWGYFLLNFRQAQAWQWWLPVFGCLLALSGTLCIVLRCHWATALTATGVFLASAYTVAWSNWPAYTVMFPAAAFWLLHAMLTTSNRVQRLACIPALGLSMAGFVLVLYPPWQVSVGYLFIAVTTGVFIRDDLWRRLDMSRSCALLAALAITTGVCFLWWQDARPAIAAIQASVYPGQRVSVGGDTALWQFFKAFLGPHTLYYSQSELSNQSELSSYVYLFPVALAILLRQWCKGTRPDAVGIVLAAFCLWVSVFQLSGIPAWLSQTTLWSRVPDYRSDLALGLSGIMLCTWVALRTARSPEGGKWAFSVSAAFTFAVALIVMKSPAEAVGHPPLWLMAGILAVTATLSVFMARGRVHAFLGLWLAALTAHTIFFNPWAMAPSRLNAVASFLPEQRWPEPVLSVATQVEAMNLAAAGVSVVNGVFYYAPKQLWERLDPQQQHLSITQRYQHLVFQAGEPPPGTSYEISAPIEDMVRVSFDPSRFDFRLTGAKSIIAPIGLDLSKNHSLRPLAARQSYAVYTVE